jgi:hypothetical protein
MLLKYINLNPLGVIIKNVSSNVFCASRLFGREEQKMYREPFLMKFFLFSIRFSIENHSN